MSHKIAPKVQALLVELGQADVKLIGAQNSQAVAEKRAEVDKLNEKKSSLRRQAAGTQIRAQDLNWDIDRLKSDLDKLHQRIQAEEAAIATTDDLEEKRDLKHDLRATRRRLAELEADLARAEQHRDAYVDHHDSTGANTDDLLSDIAVAQRDLDAAIEASKQRILSAQTAVDALRERVAEAAGADAGAGTDAGAAVLDLYDQRSKEAGIGAARLRGRICGACGMELSNATLAELSGLALDEAGECPECGALLVRPATLDLVLGA